MIVNKKVLYLGSNSTDTDLQVKRLAAQYNVTAHGLIESESFIPNDPGFYHTSLTDLNSGAIINLAKYFDAIHLLDQPLDQWSHSKLLLTTYRVMVELEKLGHETFYKNNTNIQKFINFDHLLKNNKSFCIYPWINLVEADGNLNLCARSAKKINTTAGEINWKTNPEYQKIRQAMLKGELLPDYCKVCYNNYENKNIESYREFETREWVAKLDIHSLEDLDKIERPYYYELRLGNKCNLMCRSCVPMHSSLIERESKKFNVIHQSTKSIKYSSIDIIDVNSLTSKTRVYLTGGEPTVMTEVYEFMEKCIKLKKVDFDFTLGINGQKISKKFLNLCSHFTNMSFSVSLDGYGLVNDYWRWGSNFDTIVKNTHLLEDQGHSISINCVPGIYNVTNLHLLFEFLDQEFPNCGLYLQINHISEQSVFNHPNNSLVVKSMEKCKKTRAYYTDGKSVKTCIDSLYDHYSNDPVCDIALLKKFFEMNDRLDQIRNVRLKDYIPELDECRKYIV